MFISSFYYANDLCNILAFISLISAVLVITVRNPVNSVLWLIVSFVSVASYLITAGITYIGLSYIIVYVGAIAVLFLFVVIILDITSTISNDISQSVNNTWPLAIIIVAICYYSFNTIIITSTLNIPTSYPLREIINLLNSITFSTFFGIGINIDISINMNEQIIEISNTYIIIESVLNTNLHKISQVQVLGITLYTNGAVWLIIVSVLLMLAIIVPLALCMDRPKNILYIILNPLNPVINL